MLHFSLGIIFSQKSKFQFQERVFFSTIEVEYVVI